MLVGAALVVAAVGLQGDVGRVILAPLLLLLVTATAWVAATRKGAIRVAATVVAVVLVAVIGHRRVHGRGPWRDPARGARAARGIHAPRPLRAAAQPEGAGRAAGAGTPVEPAARGVLIMNAKSGGGKVERFGLVEECRQRGIEPIVLQPGQDLLELARSAIDGGADVIGMAGGDGSQALVSSVAMAKDVPFVVIPAGTRNRFALDLGIDRDDVVAALDAFGAAVERRIDLAEVNGRIFVNNVSLGVYAKVVQSAEYRDAKRQTTLAMLGDLVGPGAEPFDLRFVGPDGAEHDGARIIQISNNPYRLTSLAGFGSRLGSTPASSGSRPPTSAAPRTSPASSPPSGCVASTGSRAGSVGTPSGSPSSRARPWRRASMARPCCWTRRWCSAACRGCSGSGSPPRRSGTPPPRFGPRRCGGRSPRCGGRRGGARPRSTKSSADRARRSDR